jgi:hypothetical protein
MKKINLLMMILLLVGLVGVALGQNTQVQAARREDRDLAQRELITQINAAERRNYEVQIVTAETYFVSRIETGIRGRARISSDRSTWRNISFEGMINIRRNTISNLRWQFEDNVNDRRDDRRDDRRYNDRRYDNQGQSGPLRPGRYEIQLIATNRFLSIGNDRRTVVQNSNSGRYSQWDIEDAGNGYFYIRSVDTGDVMTVQGRGASGDAVVLARQNRIDQNQLWLIKPGPDNGYYFTTQRNLSLDSPSSARNDGGRIQIYNSNGEANQRFRLRLISDSNVGGIGRDRNDRDRDQFGRDRDRNNGGPGSLIWRGRVDDVTALEIRDRIVRDRVISGRPAEGVRADFTSALPNRDVTVSVEKRRGRGEVRVVEQPTRGNNYTAVIQIRDSSGGADEYEIEVRWN